jgi:hypothetical protein
VAKLCEQNGPNYVVTAADMQAVTTAAKAAAMREQHGLGAGM